MKLFKRKDSREAAYSVKFMVRGKTYLWSTKTNDESLARKRAKTYRENIVAGAYHLAGAMKSRSGTPTMDVLFGEYLSMLAPAEATRIRNIASMKQVMAASGLTGGDRVDQLSREVAVAWLKTPSLTAGSKNSVMRKARSLFSKDAVFHYTSPVPLPLLAGFLGVPYLKTGEKMIEIPTPEAMALAHQLLPVGSAERRGFLLGAYCGLRSAEIIAARWDWIDGNALHVGGKPDQYTPKSGHYRVVHIGDDVLRELGADTTSKHICGEERVVSIQRKLPTMLHAYGFLMRSPVHSLRRWYGSQVAKTQGLWVASKALGHSSYAVTEGSYARLLDPIGGVAMPR